MLEYHGERTLGNVRRQSRAPLLPREKLQAEATGQAMVKIMR